MDACSFTRQRCVDSAKDMGASLTEAQLKMCFTRLAWIGIAGEIYYSKSFGKELLHFTKTSLTSDQGKEEAGSKGDGLVVKVCKF